MVIKEDISKWIDLEETLRKRTCKNCGTIFERGKKVVRIGICTYCEECFFEISAKILGNEYFKKDKLMKLVAKQI